MPYRGGRRKKRRTHKQILDPAKVKYNPRTFVIARGKTTRSIRMLIQDFRKVMKPNTAVGLKERHANKLKDFLTVAGPLKISHIVAFSQSEIHTQMRIMKLPRGPTITFRVQQYALMYNIIRMYKRRMNPTKQEHFQPLLVLNNFPKKQRHTKLMSLLLRNMFAPIDPSTIKLFNCRRVVLMNYGPEEGKVEFRHYLINASPVGLNRRVKKIVKSKIPDLSKFNDISQYVLQQGALSSDSEMEDTEENRLRLPQVFPGRGNQESEKSAIRLKEIGPRMSLSLLKIEEGISTGKVLYHSYIKKTAEQEKIRDKERHKEHLLKIIRKREQEANVKRKEDRKAAKKALKEQRRLAKQQEQQFMDSDVENLPSAG